MRLATHTLWAAPAPKNSRRRSLRRGSPVIVRTPDPCRMSALSCLVDV